MKYKGLIILIIILVLTAIIGLALPNVRNLFFNRAAGTAVLSIIPAGPISATPATEFQVQVVLSTGGADVTGVDVVMNFDKSKLTVTDIIDTARSTTSFKTFVPGVTGQTTGALDKSAVMTAANTSGVIEFGAVTYDYSANQNPPPIGTYGVTTPYNGSTVLATIKFTPKAGSSGAVNPPISFAFNSTTASTTDSNVIDNGQIQSVSPYLNDVLTSVSPAAGVAVNISSGLTPTPTLTPTATPPVTSTLDLSFKMQGITTSGVNKTVVVTMQNTTTGASTSFTSIPVTSSTGGDFNANVTLTGVPSGNYNVFVKDASHLRKKIGTVNIVAGSNTAPSGMVLKAGDFDNNNILNALDIGSIINQYTGLDVVAPANSVYDIDVNGLITLYDISNILANYTVVNVNGD